jgi:AraC-like DNA-binding protein
MDKLYLTKAQQFWPLTGYLGSLGVPVNSYIERFRLPVKMLSTPELFIDEARFWRLAAGLAEREGILDWGFRAGQQLDLSVLGEFGTSLHRQPSLKVAIERFLISIGAESLHAQFDLMQQGPNYWLTIQGFRDVPVGRNIIELYDLEFLVKLVQSAAGPHWRPPSVHLQADALPEGLVAAEVSTGRIRFSSTMTAIAIPNELMALPMRDYLASETDSSEVCAAGLAQHDFSTSLRLLLTGYLDEGITVNDCADLVGMSHRTLQRRLAENDTTFNKLLDQTRFDLAKNLLQDTSVSVTDICYELGYTNPANFTRAFRRWAGVSPRQHRKTA